METDDAARGSLILDAAGCAATACVVGAFPSASRAIDLSPRARVAVTVALAGTAAVCALGARHTSPTPRAMSTAAAANAAWVAACMVALPGRSTSLGKTIVGATAVLDGLAGGVQWLLRGQPAPR